MAAEPARARMKGRVVKASDSSESAPLTRPRTIMGVYSDGKPKLTAWQLSAAMTLMRSHLGERILMSEVAAVCRLSTGYFVRAFNNSVGTAPYGWLLDQRIFKARLLLSQTMLPLAQIALECGFTDQSHFTNTFSRRVGITPSRWRRSTRLIERYSFRSAQASVRFV